jgi:hypothetical protein
VTNRTRRRPRARDWRHYNAALGRRGSLTLWVEQRAPDTWREHRPRPGGGRRRPYPDLPVTCALTLREVYGLPLRATQGLTRSVLSPLGSDLPAPHYSTLSRRAVALEEEMSPPAGPPDTLKPSHELCGEILPRAGRPADAPRQFATALARQPDRARSLFGTARAHYRAAPAEAYAAFLRARARADAHLPEFKEARGYLAHAAGR